MKIENKYIVQAIVVAANNLRLSSEKIEVVSILKHHLSECKDISAEITEMKKITEMSRLAIKLGQLFTYINSDRIDFLELSSKFKEQSQSFVLELSNMLDNVNPASFREIIKRTSYEEFDIDLKADENRSKVFDDFEISSADTETNDEEIELNNFEVVEEEKLEEKITEAEEEKEKFIMDELNDDDESSDFDFENYEESILEPIKKLENLLKEMSEGNIDQNELLNYEGLMITNAKHSSEIGFDIIANMHKIVAYTFKRIRLGKLEVTTEIIEAIRACLIVIVAVVRGKDVDITNYLKRAEEFGNYILTIK